MHKKGLYERFFKRLFDIIIAFILILIFLPLLIFVSFLVVCTSRGGLFFKQLRPGKDKKLFIVYKFRTMLNGAEKKQKVAEEVFLDDVRITFIGKILRRLKIDELPQLFNILRGDMSLVGPRPTLPDYIEMYEKWENIRFMVKPGITGLAQVNGNIHLRREEKSMLDKEYVNNITFKKDIAIIIKTVLVVIFGEDRFVDNNKRGG